MCPTSQECDFWIAKFTRTIHDNRRVLLRPGAILAIILKGFTMGAARVHERTGVVLRRSLLRTAACGIGLLALGYPAAAQTIGNNQTVNVSTIGSGTVRFRS